MSNNEMVSVPREVLVHMTNNQHKKVAAYMPDIADALRVVPPAGGEPVPSRPYASDDEQSAMTDYEIGLGHGRCEMWDKLHPHVTRLQAEVETLRAALRTEVEAGDSWKREAQDLHIELDALKVAQGDTVPKHKFDTLVQHCKRIDADIAQARAHVNEITLYQQNSVWFWQHDGEDFLESLGCPIIIQPHHLRELLKGKAQHNPIAAQVAVVLPERKPKLIEATEAEWHEAKGWNDYDSELKRLNPSL
ncbi:hypothetical protein ACW582_16350 [Pseudomonas chlororaphis]